MSHYGSVNDSRSPWGSSAAASDSGGWFRLKRRRGRWTLVVRWRYRIWSILLEWAAMTVIATAIVVAGALVGLYRAQPEIDDQGKAFADESVDAIAPSWNRTALLSRASADFLSSAPDGFYDYFGRLGRLGLNAKNRGCLGGSIIDPLLRSPAVSARYTCDLSLAHARAAVSLSLRRDLDAWRITGFYVSVPTPTPAIRPGTGHA